MSTNRLPELPPMPGRGRTKAPQRCACGCAQLTKGGRFIPGHDGKLLGWTIRVERGLIDAAPAPHTEAVKAEVARREAKRKADEAAEAAAAKAAKASKAS